nr:aldehyde dehydrogenase family protein [Anaerolineae bacterium]
MTEEFKITYTTMSVDNDALHAAFDEAVERVRAKLGSTLPLLINNKAVLASETFPVYNPADTREPLAYFQKAGREETRQAVAAAKQAYPGWAATPYEERCAIVDRVADMIAQEQMGLAAMMIMEMGKNRVEAMGDVQESADLLRYYAYLMRENGGYRRVMNSFGTNDANTSVLKPYGVWAVISPFNFPLALAAGPVSAALVTGNTVVLKPSSDAPWTAYKLVEYFIRAGAPAGVINLVTGPGSTAGDELISNRDVAGITFTGSYDTGFNRVFKQFSWEYPRPVVVEMGGKNPAVISNRAEIETAASGVVRSAFGMGGQKCSACSRVYVQADVYNAFLERLVAKTREIRIGNPLDRATVLGPLANQGSVDDYRRFISKAREDGTVIYGGNILEDKDHVNGFFVEPTIISNLPHDHELVQNELFVPIVFVESVETLDEAMEKANNVQYGLTAGFFSTDQDEVNWFLENIEAGVVYVNREAGATTGAWPGHQTFGGWKASGSSGRNIGGPWALLNYMREQSQTIIHQKVEV